MIYVCSPVGEATGGTELLQQFCAELRSQGADACMFYTADYAGSPVEEKFASYDNPYAYEIEDSGENVLVVPEVLVDKAMKYAHVKKAIWWLSVDNYKSSFPQLRKGDGLKLRKLARFVRYLPKGMKHKRLFAECAHFAQSQYAIDHLKKIGLSPESIHELSDYIDEAFCLPDEGSQQREDVILYNPKKGWTFTRKLIAADPDRRWIPLSGYSTYELIERMQSAKVYIDLGDHPGKDRVPREAAACGCCIITSKAGSARNEVDVPILARYKFDDGSDSQEILDCIDSCFADYALHSESFNEYRDRIAGEKESFSQEVRTFLDVMRRS